MEAIVLQMQVGETEDQVNQLITSGSWFCEPALYFL